MSARRSDIKGYIAERARGRRDWPSDRYLAVRFASRVAAQLERLRQQQGLSYEALGERAGTSKSQAIRLLSGTYDGMTTKSIAKLASALRSEIDVTIRPVRDVGIATAPPTAQPGRYAIVESQASYRTARAAAKPKRRLRASDSRSPRRSAAFRSSR